jgi:peptidyl-prolyl cis-trans isomerase D
MLSNIRSAAESWLGKIVLTILFGFLIVSFAIWGIGDIFRGGSAQSVARVGKTEISADSYRRAYQNQLLEAQQRTRGLTAEEARRQGLDKQVLNQLTGEVALDQVSRDLNMNISDAEVTRNILTQPAFRGVGGAFDRLAFENALRQLGVNEPGYLQLRRKEMLREQISDAVSGGLGSPAALLDMIERYRNEERTIRFVTVPGAIAAAIPAPEEDKLKAFHEQRSAAYRAPEFRKVHYIAIAPSEFASGIEATEQEIAAAYQRGLSTGRFGQAERRTYQQIVYPDRAAAEAALAKLKGGATFEALATERTLTKAEYEFVNRQRSDVPDQSVANAIFSLAPQAEPVLAQSGLGVALVQVISVTPGTAQPLEAVRTSLAQDVRTSKIANNTQVRRKVDELHDKIEDLRSSGKALDAIAKELNRPLSLLDGIDARGTGKTGERLPGLPDAQETLAAIFKSDKGVDNEAIRTRENGYVWFEIIDIEQGRVLVFNEVRDRVLEAWRNDEAARQSNEQANEWLKRAEAGEDLEKLATELGGTVETSDAFTREGSSSVGASVAASAFALPVNGWAIAASGRGADRLILQVVTSRTPEIDAANAVRRAIKQQLDLTLADELVAQFVNAEQRRLGVSINERAAGLVTGAQQAR